MTCMPCSYCSAVGFSPIFAKWPLTDMMVGAVGCRVLLAGRLSLRSLTGEATAAMMKRKLYSRARMTEASKARDERGGVAKVTVVSPSSSGWSNLPVFETVSADTSDRTMPSFQCLRRAGRFLLPVSLAFALI